MLKPGFRVLDEQRRPLVDSIGRCRRTLSVSKSRTGLGREDVPRCCETVALQDMAFNWHHLLR